MAHYAIKAHEGDLTAWRTAHPGGQLVVGFEFIGTVCRFESDNPHAITNTRILLRDAGIRATIETIHQD